MKRQKSPIFDILKKYVTKENIEKVSVFLEKSAVKVADFMEKNGELVENTLDTVNDTIKANTPILCDVVQIESLSPESIKNIVMDSNVTGFKSVALLRDGYNVKEDKHMFYMMFLDGANTQLKGTNVIFITSDNVDVKLKNNFNEKDLLIIK